MALQWIFLWSPKHLLSFTTYFCFLLLKFNGSVRSPINLFAKNEWFIGFLDVVANVPALEGGVVILFPDLNSELEVVCETTPVLR